MLLKRWNQPPCRNMAVRGEYHDAESPMTHAAAGLTWTAYPAGRRWRNSAGMRPSSHTEVESAGSFPRPWTKIQHATLTATMAIVTTGIRTDGFSSL